MSELQDLYQEVIIDHGRRPRNFRVMPDGCMAEGYNPLCGDHFQVWVRVEGDTIADVSFQGSGCAISTSSASLMTEALKGMSKHDAEDLFQRVHAEMTGQPDPLPDGPELGKLEVFAGVQNFPMRVKCATLAWHTVKAALRNEAEPVSTE
jgi:nitrogen fixation NifU-like protein